MYHHGPAGPTVCKADMSLNDLFPTRTGDVRKITLEKRNDIHYVMEPLMALFSVLHFYVKPHQYIISISVEIVIAASNFVLFSQA